MSTPLSVVISTQPMLSSSLSMRPRPEDGDEAPTTTFPSGDYSIKGKERQSQDFGQSPHSEIQSFKGNERQYQDFEESFDGDKSKEKQTPLQGYEEIEMGLLNSGYFEIQVF
ncbi:hypothetical protein PPACK8108_LOCUS25968 [Phakopsora pachyrhizi]|uniref:Uncharacterized protein n=1 Tax=Phakopsora pachyrhizi TaxID=170000 RepID=A0AAV0BVR4_PHAPC|nr:hypothetical protein PPACK8108_LOCUS25968 [Phakopsora pachyrhizi]